MNKKNYNDYDFIKQNPTLYVERIDNYNITPNLGEDIVKMTQSFVTIINKAYDKQIVDTIKEYIKKNNINSATIIDEHSLLDTLEKASKYKAIEKALDLIKQKRDNAQNDLESIEPKIDYNDLEDVKLKLKKKKELITQIATYTDCIATIEAEMGRTER